MPLLCVCLILPFPFLKHKALLQQLLKKHSLMHRILLFHPCCACLLWQQSSIVALSRTTLSAKIRHQEMSGILWKRCLIAPFCQSITVMVSISRLFTFFVVLLCPSVTLLIDVFHRLKISLLLCVSLSTILNWNQVSTIFLHNFHSSHPQLPPLPQLLRNQPLLPP